MYLLVLQNVIYWVWLMFGLDDVEGLFQPKRSCDSMIYVDTCVPV